MSRARGGVFVDRGHPKKSKKYGFVRKSTKYKIIGDILYMKKGVDLVLRRVPWKADLYRVLEENDKGACGGHFSI